MHEAVDIGSDKFMEWVAKYPCQMLLVCLDIKFTSVIQDIFYQNLGVKADKKVADKGNKAQPAAVKKKFDIDGNEIQP